MAYRLQPADMREKWAAYRRECDANVEMVRYQDKLIPTPKKIIYCVEGFCLFAGIGESELAAYEKNKNYCQLFKDIRYAAYGRKLIALFNGEGSTTGLMFDLKCNYGWHPNKTDHNQDYNITMDLGDGVRTVISREVIEPGSQEDSEEQVIESLGQEVIEGQVIESLGQEVIEEQVIESLGQEVIEEESPKPRSFGAEDRKPESQENGKCGSSEGEKDGAVGPAGGHLHLGDNKGAGETQEVIGAPGNEAVNKEKQPPAIMEEKGVAGPAEQDSTPGQDGGGEEKPVYGPENMEAWKKAWEDNIIILPGGVALVKDPSIPEPPKRRFDMRFSWRR